MGDTVFRDVAPRRPRAFIFDCDGTLLDSMGAWLDVEPRLLASYGVPGLTQADFAEFEPLSVEDECEGYHRKWGVGASGAEVCDRLLGMLREAYAEQVGERPGARAFLEAAAAAGIPCAVATSTPADLVRAGLARNGMSDLVAGVTTTAEAGRSKESPDVYDLALERTAAGAPHGDVWVFEDAVFGLRSAGAAGYRRVGIFDPAGRCSRADVEASCDIFIEGYDEGLLGRILAARPAADGGSPRD